MQNTSLTLPISAAEQFSPSRPVRDVRIYGKGNVHDTFLVTLEGVERDKFILQRLNTHVFNQPHLIINNIQIFSEHMAHRLRREPLSSGRRWEVPVLLLTGEGQDLWLDPEGSFWRAISFIEKARVLETIQNLDQAREVGWALAMFHRLLSDLPIETLSDTLEGFHITPRYLDHYDRVLAENRPPQSPEVEYGLRFVAEKRMQAGVLESAKAQGRLRLRPIHGDPKVNNVLFDTDTNQAVGLIDLDTVKPGLIHYDIGDCLRSGCNPMGEEAEDWKAVRFDPDLCRAVLQGYLPVVRDTLGPHDWDYLYEALRLIAFELGLRFFTDFLEGNIYFKADQPNQNLRRALVQFKLSESIESQAADIKTVILETR
jgi:hypothetical protein